MGVTTLNKEFHMKTLTRIAATVAVALTLSTGLAGAATINSTCAGDPVKTVGNAQDKTLTVSNTKILVGNAADLVLNGSHNCVVAGSSDYIVITGNDNYASASDGYVVFKGTTNYFKSNGDNFVKCGGAHATLLDSDYGVNCVEE